LKRDADSQMREKDTAIVELRSRLEDLDKQRGELTATFDERLKARRMNSAYLSTRNWRRSASDSAAKVFPRRLSTSV